MSVSNGAAPARQTRRTALIRAIKHYKLIYLMLLPGLIYYIVFRYFPMWGLAIAFKNFRVTRGFFASEWVGLDHFIRFFESGNFRMLFTNTLAISTMNLVFYFPIPILFALLLNEVRAPRYKTFVQSSIYLPYFISWIVVVSIVTTLLNVNDGLVNQLLAQFGLDKVGFLTSTTWFRPLIVLEMIWRESGYGTIIFLAAIAGIDPALYEAATIDGANRWQKMLHVTLSGIRSTVVVMLLLRLGTFFELGFDQIFLQLNGMNRAVGEVFDTYIFRVGIQNGDYSYTTAIGMFKSVTGLILVSCANGLVKRLGEEGIF